MFKMNGYLRVKRFVSAEYKMQKNQNFLQGGLLWMIK